MSQFKYAEIADTVYFWFAANATTGAADDGATPLYDVRLAGAAADAIPTASGTPTLLTHANYGAGLHEIAIDTTGHAAGEYAVFCTLTVSAVNPGGFCGSYLLRAANTAALDVNPVGAVTLTSLSITGQLDAGNLLVDGTTVLTGTVGTGAATLASLSVTGQLDAGSVLIDAGMDIVGALSANSLLIDTTTTLTGNVAFSGTFAVAGTTTLTGAVSMPAGLAAAITGNITGNLSGSVGSLTGHTVQTGDSYAIVNGTHGLVSIQDDIDDILTDTKTTIPGTITTAQADLNIITGASGVVIQDGSIVNASFAADALTATKIAADVHAECATAVWAATVDEASAGPTPTTAKGKLQAIWNRFFTKKTVTASAEGSYEKNDLTSMEAWTLADDDTTATRTR